MAKHIKKYYDKPENKLRNSTCALIRHSLHGHKHGYVDTYLSMLDFTIPQLMRHYESLWVDDMNWGNYGASIDDWCSDHIIAITKFNITSPSCDDFKQCWALSNLQPLWVLDNHFKYNF